MRRPRRLGAILLLAGLCLLALNQRARPARAALYWFKGIQNGPDISVCFAGDAVIKRPDRVREIVQHIQHFEDVANIRFVSEVSNVRARDAILPGGDLNALACPPPSKVSIPPLEFDYYLGDIRVALLGTNVSVDPPGNVPGDGCTQAKESNSWANPPDELALKRPCQYNLKLGDDKDNLRTGVANSTPWLNHTLHEFGHALGLAHEHARDDENAGCVPSGHKEWHIATDGFMTPYDKDSVMHYQFTPAETPSCDQIGSNYSDSGLTAYDELALHILYPEDNQVAEFVGTTVIRDSDQLSLRSAWLARGANTNVVASNFLWEIAGQQYTGPTLDIDLGVGVYTLQFSYEDLLGRAYAYTGTVRVLAEADYNAEIVAPIVANLPLLYPNSVYIPTIDLSLQPDQNVGFFFPANLFDGTVVIDYARQQPFPVGRQPIGVFYEIEATYLATSQPAQILPGQTYEVTIHYDDAMVPVSVNESQLALYYLDAGQWIKEGSSTVDVANNLVTATPGHFSTWAVLAPNQLYLPLIIR